MDDLQQQTEVAEPTQLVEQLQEYLPDDLYSKVKDGILRQDDYTRKTQELADMRRQLEAQNAQNAALYGLMVNNAAGRQQQPQQAPQLSELDRTWQETTAGLEDKSAVEPVRKLVEAGVRDATSVATQRLAAYERQIAEMQAEKAYNQLYENTVKPAYGSELDSVWGEAVTASMNHIRQTGQVIDPLTIITQYRPDLIQKAALENARKQQPRQPQDNLGFGMEESFAPQPTYQSRSKDLLDPANIVRRVTAMSTRGGA